MVPNTSGEEFSSDLGSLRDQHDEPADEVGAAEAQWGLSGPGQQYDETGNAASTLRENLKSGESAATGPHCAPPSSPPPSRTRRAPSSSRPGPRPRRAPPSSSPGEVHSCCSGEFHGRGCPTDLELELRSVERRAESLRRKVKESRRPPPRQETKEKASVSAYLSRANECEEKLKLAEMELENLRSRLSSIEEVHRKEMEEFITRVTTEHQEEVDALQKLYDTAEAERIRFREKVDDLEPALRKSNAVAEMLAKQLSLGGDAEELREKLMRLEGAKQDALVDRTLSISEIAEGFGIDIKCPCVLSRGVELEDIITHLMPNMISELGPYAETAQGKIRTVWGPEARPWLEAWEKHEHCWCSLECSPDYRAVRLLVPSGVDKLPENPVTYINREAVLPGCSKPLTHGDVLSFSCSPTEFSLLVPYHAQANPNFHQIWEMYGCERSPATSSKATLEDVGFNEAWDSLPHAEIEPSESEREKHRAACQSHFKQMLASKGEEVTRDSIEQWKTAACFWRLYFVGVNPE